MSETGMNFSNPLHGQRKPGSIGLPLPGVQGRIIDPDTLADMPRGRIGEIQNILPGFISPLGSKRSLIRRIRS